MCVSGITQKEYDSLKTLAGLPAAKSEKAKFNFALPYTRKQIEEWIKNSPAWVENKSHLIAPSSQDRIFQHCYDQIHFVSERMDYLDLIKSINTFDSISREKLEEGGLRNLKNDFYELRFGDSEKHPQPKETINETIKYFKEQLENPGTFSQSEVVFKIDQLIELIKFIKDKLDRIQKSLIKIEQDFQGENDKMLTIINDNLQPTSYIDSLKVYYFLGDHEAKGFFDNGDDYERKFKKEIVLEKSDFSLNSLKFNFQEKKADIRKRKEAGHWNIPFYFQRMCDNMIAGLDEAENKFFVNSFTICWYQSCQDFMETYQTHIASLKNLITKLNNFYKWYDVEEEVKSSKTSGKDWIVSTRISLEEHLQHIRGTNSFSTQEIEAFMWDNFHLIRFVEARLETLFVFLDDLDNAVTNKESDANKNS